MCDLCFGVAPYLYIRFVVDVTVLACYDVSFDESPQKITKEEQTGLYMLQLICIIRQYVYYLKFSCNVY